jgi:hypothetical protein
MAAAPVRSRGGRWRFSRFNFYAFWWRREIFFAAPTLCMNGCGSHQMVGTVVD